MNGGAEMQDDDNGDDNDDNIMIAQIEANMQNQGAIEGIFSSIVKKVTPYSKEGCIL